ncbi:xanthine dehydrogenase family protein subunit M [Peribacillus cavernae]|uniref:Xanthine dehydrogenase family protein subunit M n=1 Tax=Peribacillus cavernae TaxID=1674310 RepID=A0A433HRV8_9BACI|nr:xanthine dehydrogenase family protein subunit M [Peribacillus cavernae]MDQ0218750.1 carbon-monoxide dehydrogenase medium subunit [Peribacillus cavernae]RUQ30963.1 xanthine dehydrogenase family protein subunit M [Peribacillus cavernae]
MALDFEWIEPESLEEVKQALSSGDIGTRIVSGGTALSLIMKQGIYSPERLVSLKRVKQQLNYIKADELGNLYIGCMTTLRDMELSPLVQKLAPVIIDALHHVANPRIRYVASIGGNLSHGDAHLDLPPILLAMGAKIKAESTTEERWIELKDFFHGYYETSLEPSEILTEVFIPKQDNRLIGTYMKYTTLSNDDWPTLGVAAFLRIEDGIVSEIRLVVSAVTDVPTQLTEVEEMLWGKSLDEELIEKAALRAYDIVEPLEDLRGSVWYKKEMVKVHIRRVLNQLLLEA